MRKFLLYLLLFIGLHSQLIAQSVYSVEGSKILKNGIEWEFVGTNNMAVYSLPYNYSPQQSQGMDITRECIDMKMTSDAALQTLINSARSKGQVVILAGFWYDSDGFNGGKTPWPDCELLGRNPMADPRYPAIMKRWKEIVNLPFIKNKSDVWINPWNEPYAWDGTGGYSNDLWEKDSKAFVDSIRSTGANNIIALNGSHTGQGHAVIIERGKNVRQGRSNIIFDIHAYARWDVGVSTIRARFKALRDAGNAFIIGEFAANGDYVYQSIMEACRADKVSLLAWLWGQYKEPFASIYKKYTMAPRNPESVDVSIVGKTNVVPGESNLSYRLSSYSKTWTMNWAVKGSGKIIGRTDSTAVVVDWGCSDDSLFCHINTGTRNITIPFGVKITPFTISSPFFVNAGQTNVLLQTPYVRNATYKWTLPEGVQMVGKADSSEIFINWGTKTDTVKLSVEGPCGTSTLSKALLLPGKYAYPNPASPHILPGTIESVDFDYGGEGTAYHDLEPANQGSGDRSEEGVDTEMNDGGGNIGWTGAGEWISYSIKVEKPGKYFAELRVASGAAGGSLNVLINGENRFGTLKIPGTGGWATFTSIYPGTVELKATDTELKYFCVTDGFNIGRLIVWPLDIVAPSKPALVSTATRNTTQLVKWHKSTDNDMVARYVIYLNNDSVKSITDSTYTFRYLKAGTQYSYKVVAVDRQGNRSEPLTGDFTTWVTGTDNLQNENISVYPNPFNDEITIEGLQDKPALIEIYDTVGKLEYKKQAGSNQRPVIDVSFLKNGLYILRIHQNGKVSNMKIVKH